MEFWPLITNLILFFNYDVILRVHASIVSVIFRLFCDISRTTYRRTLKFTSNDAESTISYRCSVDKKKAYLQQKISYTQKTVLRTFAALTVHEFTHCSASKKYCDVIINIYRI